METTSYSFRVTKVIRCVETNRLRILSVLLSIFVLYCLALSQDNFNLFTEIISSSELKPALKPASPPEPSPTPVQVATTTDPIVQDPFNIYVMSAYYYPVSESMGNHSIGIMLLAPSEWSKSNNITTVRASNNVETRVSQCNIEIIIDASWCKLHNLFAGCFGVANMTKFEITLGNNTFHEIPFKTVSYEKRDVVTCISPLFAAEQWHQVIFAAHVYRRFGSFMHLYIRSVVEPVYELIKVYEQEGYLKTEPYPRFKYSSIPDYMYNPNKEVSFRAQEGCQSQCLLQYKESAQWVTFMDLDDILIPREAPTYMEEFSTYIHDAEYIHYKKANVYYEADNNPQSFSVFDIFHSAKFLNEFETGKIAVPPKYINYTTIHYTDFNNRHKPNFPMAEQNVIVHLKKAFPLGYSNETKQLWTYFYRNDTTIFHEVDAVAIEEDYKRISSKYPDIWKKLPTSLTYFPFILDCFNTKYYQVWYKDPLKLTYCFNADYCRIPPKLIAPCANADGDYFSSEDGTDINLHYAQNLRFTIGDRCVT